MALTIGELVGFVRIDNSGARRGLRQAGDDLGRFQRDADGRLRDLRGRFVSGGDAAGRGYSGGLSGAMRSGLSSLGGMVSTVAGGLGKGAGGVMGLAFAGAFIAMGTSLLAGGAMIGLSYALLKDKPKVKSAAKDLKKTATDIFKEAAEPMAKPIVEAFGNLKGLVKDLKPDIEALFQNTADSGALKSLTDGVEKFTKNVMPGLEKLTETMGPTFEGLELLMERIGKGLGSFLGSMGDAAPQVKTLLGDIGIAIQGILWWAGKFFGFWAQAYTYVRDFVIKVIDAFKWLYNVLVGNSIIPDLVNAVVEWMLSLPGKILGGISSFVSMLVEKFTQMAAWLLAKVAGAVSSVVGWFKRLPGMAFRALAPLAGQLAARAVEAGGRFYRSMVAKFNSAVSWVRGLPGRISRGIGSLGSLLYGKGQDIARGLLNGIKSMGGWIAGQLKGWASSIVPGPIARALGIASPSKVMADKIGRWIPAGIVKGIRSGEGALDTAMRDLGKPPDPPGGAALAAVAANRRAFGSASPYGTGAAGATVAIEHWHAAENGTPDDNARALAWRAKARG